MRYEKNFFITIVALVFVILKHSLQWRDEFHLYFGPVPEFLLVNSAARRFSMAASFAGNFLSSFLYWCFHWPYLVVQVYELITCVRRANENAGNLISGVQFLKYIYIYKTELRILDFQLFHSLAGHRLSAHIPALWNMVNESKNKESWIKNFPRNWRSLKIV